MDEQAFLRPVPRKAGTFSLTPISTTSSPADPTQPDSATLSRPPSTTGFPPPGTMDHARSNGDAPPSKSRSILNLTSSTLFGIYSPTGYDNNREEPLTPWGTGSQTPARTSSIDVGRGTASRIQLEDARQKTAGPSQHKTQRHSKTRSLSVSGANRPPTRTRQLVVSASRVAALFVFGLAYGGLVTQLQGTSRISKVQVDAIDKRSWMFMGFWGVLGIALGSLLPWVDSVSGTKQEQQGGNQSLREVQVQDDKEGDFDSDKGQGNREKSRSSLGADWNPVVRSIGAFVGVAFAIRRLPWESTLQVSLTLALANPVIWYLLDRSRAGFTLSAAFSLTGTFALLTTNPAILPVPFIVAGSERLGPQTSTLNGSAAGTTTGLSGGGWDVVSYESVWVATWISSVLFCSCVCFGNIGRRLASVGSDGAGTR